MDDQSQRAKAWNVFDLRARGVDALLQVGYHSRAELDAFVPHTYVPELVLHVDDEPIGSAPFEGTSRRSGG